MRTGFINMIQLYNMLENTDNRDSKRSVVAQVWGLGESGIGRA
jgi:hypothetical protein